MNLSEIISLDRVVVGQAAASKKKALEELSALLATATPEVSSNEIFTSLIAREKLGNTGLGHGVAIPHGSLSGVDQSVGAFLRLESPVDCDADDGQAVDLIFGLVVPQPAGEEHQQHLSAITKLFADEAACEAIRNAVDAGAVRAILAPAQTAAPHAAGQHE